MNTHDHIVDQHRMLSVLFVLWWAGVGVSQRIVFVDEKAGGMQNGTTWEHAHVHLQDALAEVAGSRETIEIRVAAGVYKPDQGRMMTPGNGIATFRLFSSVVMKGGYAGNAMPDPNARDMNRYPTILSGDLEGNDPQDNSQEPWNESDHLTDNVQTVVTVADVDATIDGFLITGGHYDIIDRGGGDTWGGGGMSVARANPQIVNCSFVNNRTIRTSGGAVFVGPGCRLTIVNSIFRNNYARASGGALHNEGGDVNLERCVFTRNRSETSGGAIGSSGGHVSSASCEFVGNSSVSRGPGFDGFGGAVAGDLQSTLEFENSLLIANTAMLRGGAIAGSNIRLTNCTIVGNRAGGNAGLYINHRPAELFNCIVWKNENGPQEEPGLSNWLGTCSYCCLDCSRDASLVVGNIEEEPAFVMLGHWDSNGTPENPDDDVWIDGDYHLKSQAGRWDAKSQSWMKDTVTSPCIDAGDPNSPVGEEPFPNGGRINMGAYGGTSEASTSYFGEPVCETIVAGDINGDCKVDFLDLAILSQRWLANGDVFVR